MAVEQITDRGARWFMGVCGMCGEKSLPVELRSDSVPDQERRRVIGALTVLGWEVSDDQAYCPGCKRVRARKQALA